MCGIAGIIQNSTGIGGRQKIVQAMINKMRHRGPDDKGFYHDEVIGLGHTRLSIIDVEGGHQPMLSEDGRYCLIFNGEIYNYRELKETLKGRGYGFRTKSDTEVLLYWLKEYGVAGISDLNGMFAFALWDKFEKSLLMARDRLGIKPVYYHFSKTRFIFASEIKAILLGLDSREPDLETIFEFVTFQNVLSDGTFFKSIKKLTPGNWIKWKDNEIQKGVYWDVVFNREFGLGFADTVDRYKDVLTRSVARHLISDVPVGSYLSGGIDSASVAVLAAEMSSAKLHTFTGAFTDSPYYDERVGSRAVADQMNASVHEIEIRPQDYLDHIEEVIYHLDEPTLGTGALPQFMVARMVSKDVKVVLTGHGGDELFGGYQVNKVALLRETARNNPAKLAAAIRGIRMDEWTRVLYFLLYPLLFPEVRHGLFIMVPSQKRNRFLSGDFLAMNKGIEPLAILDAYDTNYQDLPGEKILRLYLKTYLPTLFIQEDKVGMAHSVEARTPLCDNEMVALALNVPLAMKLWGNKLKALPKAAMRPYLEKSLYALPKRGFPTPFARWYRREPLQSYVADLLFGRRTRERGLFNTETLKTLFHKNIRSKTDNLFDYERANKMYSFSAIELWFRIFIDDQGLKCKEDEV